MSQQTFTIEIDGYRFKVKYTPGYNTSPTYDYGEDEDFVTLVTVINEEGKKMNFSDLDFDEYYELVLDDARNQFNEEHEYGLFLEEEDTESEYNVFGPEDDLG